MEHKRVVAFLVHTSLTSLLYIFMYIFYKFFALFCFIILLPLDRTQILSTFRQNCIIFKGLQNNNQFKNNVVKQVILQQTHLSDALARVTYTDSILCNSKLKTALIAYAAYIISTYCIEYQRVEKECTAACITLLCILWQLSVNIFITLLYLPTDRLKCCIFEYYSMNSQNRQQLFCQYFKTILNNEDIYNQEAELHYMCDDGSWPVSFSLPLLQSFST